MFKNKGTNLFQDCFKVKFAKVHFSFLRFCSLCRIPLSFRVNMVYHCTFIILKYGIQNELVINSKDSCKLKVKLILFIHLLILILDVNYLEWGFFLLKIEAVYADEHCVSYKHVPIIFNIFLKLNLRNIQIGILKYDSCYQKSDIFLYKLHH